LAAAGLGGDDDHTTGAAGAVDGGGTTVFQHVHGGNVIGVYAVEVCTDHAIYDDQRLRIGTQGRQAPEPDVELAVGIALRHDNTKPRHLALQQLCGIVDVTQIELLGLDIGDGTGDFALLHAAIPHHDNLVQQRLLLAEHDVQGAAGWHGRF